MGRFGVSQWTLAMILALGIPSAQLAAQSLRLLPPAPAEAPFAPPPLATPTAEPLVEPTIEVMPAPPADPEPPAAEAVSLEAESILVESADAGEADPLLDEAAEPSASWYQPIYWFGPAPWDSGFEIGLNGSSGTSETLSIRTGGFIKRKTKRTKTDVSLYYNKTNADGVETQSNLLFDGRQDFLSPDTPWTWYVNSQAFYDQFSVSDVTVNINTGAGYRIFDADWAKLLARFGAGAAREFGAPNDQWTPEAQFGFDWDQPISETQKFYAKMDFFPEWEDFNNYRLTTDVGYEIELNRPANASLKISATDRFRSESGGDDPHILNYSVLLIWKL